jgi:hypothetical protein
MRGLIVQVIWHDRDRFCVLLVVRGYAVRQSLLLKSAPDYQPGTRWSVTEDGGRWRSPSINRSHMPCCFKKRRREIRHHFGMSLFGCAKALNEGFFHVIVLAYSTYLAINSPLATC